MSAAKDSYDKVIRAVYKQKLKTMEALSRDIEELERMVNEYIANPQSDASVSKLCSETQKEGSGIREELCLIHYNHDIEEFLLKTPSLFTYSASKWLFQPQSNFTQSISPQMIPLFRKFNQMYFLPGCAESHIPNDVRALAECTSWMFVSDEYLFLCGEPKKSGAYILEIKGFAFNPTEKSIYRHEKPGLGRHSDYIYLFGGLLNDVPQKYCERYCLSQDTWSALPNMQFPRSTSLPCLHKDLFYLLGGEGTNTAEVFDPFKLRFQTLTLEMRFSAPAFTVEYDQDLYWFSQGRVHSWEMKMGAEYLTEVVDMSDDVFFYTDTGCPLRIGDELFFFGLQIKNKQNCLFSFDLSSKRLAVKATISPSFRLF